MTFPGSEKLHVLVVAAGAALAADVARMAAADAGVVTLADADAARLAALEVAPGENGAPIETVWVDFADSGQVRAWAATLADFRRTPQLVICCCAAACAEGRRPRRPADVALTPVTPPGCPAMAAAEALRPDLFLHAEPLRRSVFDRALAVIRHPTLSGLLTRERLAPADALAYAKGGACAGRRLHLIPSRQSAPAPAA
jgi:hypothetical protein